MANKIKILFFEQNVWIRENLSKSLFSELKRQGLNAEIHKAEFSREAWVMAENSDYKVAILAKDAVLPDLGQDILLSERMSRRLPDLYILIPHNDSWLLIRGEDRNSFFANPAQIIIGLFGGPKLQLVR